MTSPSVTVRQEISIQSLILCAPLVVEQVTELYSANRIRFCLQKLLEDLPSESTYSPNMLFISLSSSSISLQKNPQKHDSLVALVSGELRVTVLIQIVHYRSRERWQAVIGWVPVCRHYTVVHWQEWWLYKGYQGIRQHNIFVCGDSNLDLSLTFKA